MRRSKRIVLCAGFLAAMVSAGVRAEDPPDEPSPDRGQPKIPLDVRPGPLDRDRGPVLQLPGSRLPAADSVRDKGQDRLRDLTRDLASISSVDHDADCLKAGARIRVGGSGFGDRQGARRVLLATASPGAGPAVSLAVHSWSAARIEASAPPPGVLAEGASYSLRIDDGSGRSLSRSWPLAACYTRGTLRARVVTSSCAFRPEQLSVHATNMDGPLRTRGPIRTLPGTALKPRTIELSRVGGAGSDFDFVFEGSDVPFGTWDLLGSFTGDPCPGGSWSRSVAILDDSRPRVEATIRYTVPRTETSIGGHYIAALLQAALRQIQLRINNYTPRNRRGTWYQAGDAFLQLPAEFGGARFNFAVPEVTSGNFHYYVNDLEVQAGMISVVPEDSRFRAWIPFESLGVELKGHCWGRDRPVDPACGVGSDSTAPDGHLDDLVVTLFLTPTFWNGKDVTLAPTQVEATGNISARGIAAPVVAMLRSEIEGLLFAQVERYLRESLDGPGFKDAVAVGMRQILDGHGVEEVQAVEMRGRELLVTHVPPRSR